MYFFCVHKKQHTHTAVTSGTAVHTTEPQQYVYQTVKGCRFSIHARAPTWRWTWAPKEVTKTTVKNFNSQAKLRWTCAEVRKQVLSPRRARRRLVRRRLIRRVGRTNPLAVLLGKVICWHGCPVYPNLDQLQMRPRKSGVMISGREMWSRLLLLQQHPPERRT
jgi:hypothetical protein